MRAGPGGDSVALEGRWSVDERAVALAPAEQVELAALEATIEQNLAAFVAVGTALLTIRDKRLYRRDYHTFEAYCGERWGLKRQRAYELMEAAGVVTVVSEISDTAPARLRLAELFGISVEQIALGPAEPAPERPAQRRRSWSGDGATA